MKNKRLLVSVGPNVPGKSAIWKEFSRHYQGWNEVLYINTDDLKKEVGIDNLTGAAAAEREDALNNGNSFIVKTVTERNIDLMRRAKDSGYIVDVLFVVTHDPETNTQRGADSVEKEGRNAPTEKTSLRYLRSLNLLPKALDIADNVMVYNNSFNDPRLIIEKQNNGAIMLHPQSPPSRWDEQALHNLIGEQHSKSSIINNITAFKKASSRKL
jgi:predicted ABC-type ATPase